MLLLILSVRRRWMMDHMDDGWRWRDDDGGKLAGSEQSEHPLGDSRSRAGLKDEEELRKEIQDV